MNPNIRLLRFSLSISVNWSCPIEWKSIGSNSTCKFVYRTGKIKGLKKLLSHSTKVCNRLICGSSDSSGSSGRSSSSGSSGRSSSSGSCGSGGSRGSRGSSSRNEIIAAGTTQLIIERESWWMRGKKFVCGTGQSCLFVCLGRRPIHKCWRDEEPAAKLLGRNRIWYWIWSGVDFHSRDSF